MAAHEWLQLMYRRRRSACKRDRLRSGGTPGGAVRSAKLAGRWLFRRGGQRLQLRDDQTTQVHERERVAFDLGDAEKQQSLP